MRLQGVIDLRRAVFATISAADSDVADTYQSVGRVVDPPGIIRSAAGVPLQSAL